MCISVISVISSMLLGENSCLKKQKIVVLFFEDHMRNTELLFKCFGSIQ